MTKLALCTTFPNTYTYPQESIASWVKFLPKDLMILVGLDPCAQMPETEKWLYPLVEERLKAETLFLSREFTPEQIEFLTRHKVKEEKDYRLDYRRFSFKVFALHRAMTFALEEQMDYLVWIDADVVLKKELSLDDIEKWLPKDKVASYLGRKDWDHSECGFMIFNLKNGGKEFLDRLVSAYITDEVLTFKQWHDSFVFDVIRDEFNKANGKDVFFNLTKNVEGRDVFDICVLSEFMEHKKGNRKFNSNPGIGSNVIDLNQLQVQTKNCVNHDIIIKNVTENLTLIKNWLDICLPNEEEIVIANAGPSLCVEDIRSFYERGVKIVAVKHALQQLFDADIIPWGCMLLDPREHVKDFVTHPKANQINWFVASMVDPEVTKTLLEQGCRVFGYHAYVGAEEQKILPKDHKMVCGGSATSTRGIAVLDMLGFKKFHLFAYDLCALIKPNLKEKKGTGPDAKPIWYETTLTVESYRGNEMRTFWTKGEFLAQVQELKGFFEKAGALTFSVYGEGIIPWMYRHFKLHQKMLKDKNEKVFKGALDINDFLQKDVG